MKKNENLELMKEILKQEPPKTERKTMRQSLRDCLYQIAQNEELMKETLEKNPELYQLTMKVAIEEERRRQNEK